MRKFARRTEFRRALPFGFQSGGEESVCGGLGEDVGEFGEGEFADEILFESAEDSGEFGFFVLRDFFHQIAEESGFSGHDFGKALGGGGFAASGFPQDAKVLQEFRQFVRAVADGTERGIGNAGDGDGFGFSVRIVAEFQVVREDEVGQGGEIAGELGAFDFGVEVGADVLGFHKADGDVVFRDGEVGRAAGASGGFVDDLPSGE